MEIAEPRSLVLRHEQAGHDFTMTIRCDELAAERERAAEPAADGTTAGRAEDDVRMTWMLCFEDLAETERLVAIVLGANEQNFVRLAAYLAAP